MSNSTQLPLNLHLRDDAIFENYIVGRNKQLIHHLQQFVRPDRVTNYIYCYGGLGVGRSHLLQACCHVLSTYKKTPFYLPLSHAAELTPEVLDGLERCALVCIDDIDAVMGDPTWEEALFHLYNRIRDSHVALLISANRPPKQLSCKLPDLQTRLSSGLVLKTHALSDADKKQALQMRAANRGLILSDDVSQFLFRHYSRNMGDLFTALEKLDQASLVAKRRITIPFVKAVLDW